MKKILVITPVSHLDGVIDLLLTKGGIFLTIQSTKKEVRDLLIKHNIDIIVCNPNQQSYIIDKELFHGT